MVILIIEDEPKTASYLRKGFAEYGVKAEIASDGEDGLQRALSGKYDFLILDVMLPQRDGWSVISELRRRGSEVPVIMLTALEAFPSRVKGLELGVDDYVVKPFSFAELHARVRTILRRGTSLKKEMIRIGDLELDLDAHRATRGGDRLDLTPKEFAILTLLARHPGEVMTRIRILERIWDRDYDESGKVLDVQIKRLRSKVDDPFQEKLIHTVRGVGYVLEYRGPEKDPV